MTTEVIEIYNLLKELFILLDDGDRQLLSRFNLSVPRFYILVHLGEQPGISFRQLSDLILCDKSNVTRLIKGLEMDGLVERKPHETDGRTYRLFLTDSGEQVREKALAAHTLYNQQRLSITLEQGNLYEQLVELKKSLLAQLDPVLS